MRVGWIVQNRSMYMPEMAYPHNADFGMVQLALRSTGANELILLNDEFEQEEISPAEKSICHYLLHDLRASLIRVFASNNIEGCDYGHALRKAKSHGQAIGLSGAAA